MAISTTSPSAAAFGRPIMVDLSGSRLPPGMLPAARASATGIIAFPCPASRGVAIVCAAAPGGAAFAGERDYGSPRIVAAAAGHGVAALSAGIGGNGSGRFRAVVAKAASEPGKNAGDGDEDDYESWKSFVLESWDVEEVIYRREVYCGELVSLFGGTAVRGENLLRRMMNTKSINKYPKHCKRFLFVAGVSFRRLILQARDRNIQLDTVFSAMEDLQGMFPQIKRLPLKVSADDEAYFKELSQNFSDFVKDAELLAEQSEYRS